MKDWRAEAAADAQRFGDPWPAQGEPVHPGFFWYPTRLGAPWRAHHETAPLGIRRARKGRRGWVVEVRGRALRQHDGQYVLLENRRTKSIQPALDGEIVLFPTAGAASTEAVAYYTGARLRP